MVVIGIPEGIGRHERQKAQVEDQAPHPIQFHRICKSCSIRNRQEHRMVKQDGAGDGCSEVYEINDWMVVFFFKRLITCLAKDRIYYVFHEN